MINKVVDNNQILIDDLISNFNIMMKWECKNNKKLYDVELKNRRFWRTKLCYQQTSF